MFRRVREGDVTEVVAESGHAENLAPVWKPRSVNDLRYRLGYVGMHVLRIGDDVEDSAGQFHDSQRVLEPAMRCPWVYQIGRCQLVDVAKALHGNRVDHATLMIVEADELMHGVTYLVGELRHVSTLSRTQCEQMFK